jgi:hypothetical protein
MKGEECLQEVISSKPLLFDRLIFHARRFSISRPVVILSATLEHDGIATLEHDGIATQEHLVIIVHRFRIIKDVMIANSIPDTILPSANSPFLSSLHYAARPRPISLS